MVRIVAAMKIFNEIWHINKTIADVERLVDHIIVIDGAWQHYPGGTPRSMDGTRELLERLREQYGLSIEMHDKGVLWDSQPEARGEYFRHGHPGDWFFIVDGDYEIYCTVKLKDWIEENCTGKVNSVMIPFIHDTTLQLCYYPLILKWEPGLNYRKNHYSLCVGDEKRLISAVQLRDMTITHCHKDKPKEKKDNMMEYSIWRRDRGWKED